MKRVYVNEQWCLGCHLCEYNCAFANSGLDDMVKALKGKQIFPKILQSPINCGAIAMLAGLVIVPIVSLISPKPDKKLVDDAFACYDKQVPAKQKNSLD